MAVQTGNDNANTLTGTAGTDTLRGLGGIDTLFGLGGDDSLDGGTGNDRMEGGGGNDTYFVDNAQDVVVEGAGKGFDTVRSSVTFTLPANVERLILTTAGTKGTGNSLANTIIGSSGTNTLIGGGGNDSLNGGGGSDSLVGDDGDDTVNGGAGGDTLDGGGGDDVIIIDDAADVAQDLIGVNRIRFAPGKDGQGIVAGGTDLDGTKVVFTVMEGDQFSNTISADDGSITTGITLFGNDGDDALEGGEGNDTLFGGNGNDNIDGLLGTGVTGLNGRGGDDTIFGEAGDDILTGDDSNFGEAGNDSLNGGTGNDSLDGAGGRDRLDGGPGADSMTGGDGNDVYVVDNPGDIVDEAGFSGTDTVRSSVSFVLGGDATNVEVLILTGTKGASGIGNGFANTLTGNDGNNVLLGQGGNDILAGRGGRDTLDGGGGDDTMTGGAGNDTFVVDSASDSVVEAANEGKDTVLSSVTLTLPDNVEDLTLTGTGNLDGTGNSAMNLLVGNAGINTLTGLGGADTILGNDGNDVLFGNGSSDTLDGGLGNDTLVGGIGGGGDVLTGGLGNDVFRYTALDPVSFVATNIELEGSGAVADLVTDFANSTGAATIDRFNFLASAYDPAGDIGNGTLTTGTDFSVIGEAYDGTNAGTNANFAAGVATFVFSLADRTLYYDANGADPGYTAIATIENGTLGENDIAVVAA